jgi:WD40 repeat protein
MYCIYGDGLDVYTTDGRRVMSVASKTKIVAAAVSPSGDVIVYGTDKGELTSVNMSGDTIREFTGCTGNVGDLEFIPGTNSFVSYSVDSPMRVWDLGLREFTHEVNRSAIDVKCLMDGVHMVGKFRGDIVHGVYNLRTGELVREFETPDEYSYPHFALNPITGELAVTFDWFSISVYDPTVSHVVRTINMDSEIVRLAFSMDGYIVCALQKDMDVSLMEIDSERLTRLPIMTVLSLACTSDGRLLFVGTSIMGQVFGIVSDGRIVTCKRISRNTRNRGFAIPEFSVLL